MKKISTMKIDSIVLNFCSKSIKNKFFDKIMPGITHSNDYGQVYLLFAAVIIFYRHKINEGINIFIALILGLILGEGILKHIFKRTRPLSSEEQQLIIERPKSFSFPSGHTTSSFSALGVLWGMNSDYKYVILFIAILISFSRLYLHVHYPSDVIGGMVLGLICAKGALLITSGVNLFKVENNIIGYINLLMCSIFSKSQL